MTNNLHQLIVPKSNGICHLIRELLQLEWRLKNPDAQSWYWQKGIEGHKRRLNDLYKDYDRVRSQFNGVDSVTLTHELIAIQQFEAETLPGIHPHLTREIMRGKCERDQSRIEEMLVLKVVMRKLPTRSRLRDDESLMAFVYGVADH